MNTIVTELVTDMGATQIWGTFGEAIPYIAVIFGVALGAYLLRKLLKGASKLKFRV